jgi:hypothetical protein
MPELALLLQYLSAQGERKRACPTLSRSFNKRESPDKETTEMETWKAEGLGPRQIKKANTIISKASQAAGTKREAGSEFLYFSPFSGYQNPEALARLDAVHAKHGGVLTPENLKSALTDLETATAAIMAAL